MKWRLRFVLYKNFKWNNMTKHDARKMAKKVIKFTHFSERMKKRLGVSNLSEEDIERCRILADSK